MGTIRYIFSLCYIKEHFGNLDNMVIGELGVGYGGLAFVIGTYYKPKSYHLFDLPDVQSLALKYLKKLDIPATDTFPDVPMDLFISEFCLSEFDDTDIYLFYDKYIKNSKRIFLTMNLIDEVRKQKFIKRMNMDFDMEIYPETHGTNFPAYVIIGKK